jgi:hypothetical protein
LKQTFDAEVRSQETDRTTPPPVKLTPPGAMQSPYPEEANAVDSDSLIETQPVADQASEESAPSEIEANNEETRNE